MASSDEDDDSSDDATVLPDRIAKGLDGSKRRRLPPESSSSSSESEAPAAAPPAPVANQFPGLSQLSQISTVSMVPTAFNNQSPWAAVPQYVAQPGAMPPLRNSHFQVFAPPPPVEYVGTRSEQLAVAMARARELEHHHQQQHAPVPAQVPAQVPLTISHISAKKKRVTKKQKQKQTGTGEKETEKAKRKVVPLPPQLAAFRYSPEMRDRLALVEELDASTQQTISVAYSITTGSDVKGNKIVWILDELRTEQLRELAKLVGCKNLGSVSKYLIRREIGRKWTMGPVYDNFNIPNPVTAAIHRKNNTLFRIVNACFLPENITKLIAINESKKRPDFEAAKGKGPNAEFWRNISDTVNDAESNDLLSIVLGAESDPYLMELMEGVLNLNDFNIGSYISVSQNMKDLLRARGTIMKNKKKSGTHDDDTRNYLNKGNLKVRKDVYMPAEPVYYLDYRCKEHPGIDQAFTEALAEKHKSESTAIPVDDDQEETGKAVKPKDVMRLLEKANENFSKINLDAQERHQTMLKSQDDSKNRADWDSYIKACKDLLELRRTADTDDAVSDQVIMNLARRIRALEVALNVPEEESSVKEVL
jgi:hypothetical protein